MKGALKRIIIGRVGAALAVLFLMALPLASRGDSVTLSVTPPLFQLNVSPGDSWTSSIKVINVNPSAFTVYASVVGFEASGESGQGKFIPLVNESGNADALANWITLDHASATIPTEQTAEFGFTVHVPKDASPGGHYAAIMIGTQPAPGSVKGALVSVGSFVTSLMFVSVKGDIKEQGNIEQFATDKSVYQSPDAKFSLVFQNTGNIHVHPEGEIDIYNMWGVKQGTIPINQKTFFGAVLPSSSRKFAAEWKGEDTFFDIGKYTAVATLTYGDLAHHNVSSTVIFWVFPVARVVTVVGGTLFFLFIIIFSIKLYIRRALALEMERRGGSRQNGETAAERASAPKRSGETAPPPRPASIERVLITPITEGVVDLRKARAEMQGDAGRREGKARRAFGPLLKKYVAFLILFPLCVLALLWAVAYFREAFNTAKTYNVKVENPGHVAIPIDSGNGSPQSGN